jgi:hypothetical protein
MKVTMRVQMSGTRDGVDWPAPGESISLPDDEAAQLLAQGMAVVPGGIESASAEPVAETAEAAKATRRKA